jgi:chloramphenicol 3-O phosphotransferase
MTTNGRIILLNGTSSAGKSTLARALRLKLEPQFCYYSSDQLAKADFRPLEATVRAASREKFFEGFHNSIPAFASVGIDLLVEHIVEGKSWADDLVKLLSPFDVFWIGVHAPISELERRERLRGDRQIGEAGYHLKTHSFCKYDVEVDSMQPLNQNVNTIVDAWNRRSVSRPRVTTAMQAE